MSGCSGGAGRLPGVPVIVPASVLRAVQGALEHETGRAKALGRITSVGGGCINPSARLETESGEAFFLKWNPQSPAGMFAAEADGLQALREGAVRRGDVPAARALSVPEVLGTGGSGVPSDPGWLLLEWIPRGSPASDYGRLLGEGLAALHAAGAAPGPAGSPGGAQGAPTFGWYRHNFIGSLPQANDLSQTWSDFWRDRRLEPQLRLARDRGSLVGSQGEVFDELLHRMEEAMEGACPAGPSLLHGDLWSGNYYPGPDGAPVLIDPAVYRGAGEVDLAMMELFGNLPRGFLEGYRDVRALDPGYDRIRRDIYQLYYLLVHVNLFGGGYVSSSVGAAQRILRVL
jgi:fructosamine-3-kinase